MNISNWEITDIHWEFFSVIHLVKFPTKLTFLQYFASIILSHGQLSQIWTYLIVLPPVVVASR